MAKKTAFDISREEHLTRPPRLSGKVKNAGTKNKKKQKKA
jgi:hypothetical protein